jgi:2-hydroxychromene-2-carboxylate isomerase
VRYRSKTFHGQLRAKNGVLSSLIARRHPNNFAKPCQSWELRDILYANSTPLDDDVMRKAADDLSLDAKPSKSCVDSEKYKADVQKDANEAAVLQISGTPTFVLARTMGGRGV